MQNGEMEETEYEEGRARPAIGQWVGINPEREKV
jgi:hypothetical protein